MTSWMSGGYQRAYVMPKGLRAARKKIWAPWGKCVRMSHLTLFRGWPNYFQWSAAVICCNAWRVQPQWMGLWGSKFRIKKKQLVDMNFVFQNILVPSSTPMNACPWLSESCFGDQPTYDTKLVKKKRTYDVVISRVSICVWGNIS